MKESMESDLGLSLMQTIGVVQPIVAGRVRLTVISGGATVMASCVLWMVRILARTTNLWTKITGA